jgi:hypothetical protein
VRYDPERHPHASYGRGGGDAFESYVSDVMCLRVTDWYRAKREGNGDRRYGADQRIVLAGDVLEEVVVDPELDFERLVSERRITEWEEAARLVQLPLAEFVCMSVDRAATVIRRGSAA